MKKLSFLLLLALPIIGFSQHTLRSAANGDKYLSGVVLLKVQPEFRSACADNSVAIPAVLEILRDARFLSLDRKFKRVTPPETEFNERGQRLADISLIYELTLPENSDVLKISEQLSVLSSIAYAEAKYVSYDQYTPNDANLNSVMPYHFANVEAYDAWDISLGDTNVVIGITDTSFDIDHPDMSGNIKYNYDDPVGNGDEDSDSYIDNFAGWDMVDNDNDLFINNEIHGTAVAAIASASADNGIGYAGIGFKCKYLPVKVANNSQVVTHGYEGIQYCVDQGCSIVNCSWGNTTFSQFAQDIITWAAINNDVVVVVAAGNDNATAKFYPASYNYALSVTGVNASDIFNNGVNPPFTRNDSVDVSAPGYSVYTTATFNGNPLYSPPQGGTSMASPIVAGVAGLVRAHFPCLNALEVIERIKESADDIDGIAQNVPYAGLLGTGRVNAAQALAGNFCDPLGGMEQDNTGSEISIYPNPSRDQIIIRITPSAVWNVEVVDLKGRLIGSYQFRGDRFVLSDLPGGLFIARVWNEKEQFRKRISIVK